MNTMMDVLNNSPQLGLVVILTLSVVGVFTFIVFRNRIFVPTDQNLNTVALKARLQELLDNFSFDKEFETGEAFENFEPEEQDKVLDEMIRILEKIEPEKASRIIRSLQEKKEALAHAHYLLKDATTQVDDLELKKDLIYSELYNRTKISLYDATNSPLPIKPPFYAPNDEHTNWTLLNSFKQYVQNVQNGHDLWNTILETKDDLNSDISNLVAMIINELL